MGWNVNLNFSQTNNSISNAVTYDTTTGVRTTRPENISGNWNAGAWAGFNTALGPKKYWNFSYNLNFNSGNTYRNSNNRNKGFTVCPMVQRRGHFGR